MPAFVGGRGLPTLESRKAEGTGAAASQIRWWEAAIVSGPRGDNPCFKIKCGPFRTKTGGQVEAAIEERGKEVLS